MRSNAPDQSPRSHDHGPGPRANRLKRGLLPIGEKGYQLLFEHMDSMVCALDLEGRFTSVNRAGERLTGYPAEELVGKLAIELIAPEFREEAVRQFERRLTAAADTAPDESTLVTRDGRRIPIEITSRLLSRDGRPFGVLGLVRDVSERKSAEGALLESEQRFRSAFTFAPIGMALVAPDGRLVQVNDSLCSRVVLYTGHRDGALLERALDAGAQGFVLKEASLAELVRALGIVADGGTYVDPELSGALVSARTVESLSPLTPREREILGLLADGMTNKKVASALGISAETVQSHVRNAMGKLEADTRTQAVATAIRQSLIS